SCVARWDGSKWVDAAAGLPVGSAAARLYVHDGELHMAARHFDGSAFWRVYRLGGASWAPASEALDGGLFWSLFTHDEDLMVGGGIAQLPAYNNLARLGGQGDQLVPMEALELYVRDGVEWNGRIAVVGDHGLLVQNGATTVSTNLALWTPGKPTFYDQPDEQTVCDRQDAVFTIAAVSSNAMTYRWKRNNVPLVDGPTPHGSTIVGAALPMLRVQQSTYQDEGIYTCTATNTCTAVTSDGARLIIGGCSCGPADLGRTGGIPGADGALDNNDFVVFVDLFFQQHPAADFGTTGGVPGADGAFDNNDFVVFIDVFFAGCA
ncbi:MAG TPA: immunoglobulin domain-containing protein, partial [Phycisphaerales bacterium]|nr:immunoglobulin domain-containing protein [Phycisphaerales bacterium]